MSLTFMEFRLGICCKVPQKKTLSTEGFDRKKSVNYFSKPNSYSAVFL